MSREYTIAHPAIGGELAAPGVSGEDMSIRNSTIAPARRIRSVTLDQFVIDYLNERRFAVLATIREDGSPHLSTMWYRFDGDSIMMNTRVGRVKDLNLRRDNRAAICIEDEARYVTIDGRITFDDDPVRTQADIKALAERYGDAEEAEAIASATFAKQKRVTIRLSIDRVDVHGF
jgi:PPOX class probable F420-dependent enzyme